MRLKILLGIWATLDFAFCQYNVYRQDPFAVLSRTLLTYQQAACDGTVLNLVCPTGTKISIQLVQYGRTAPSSEVRQLRNMYKTPFHMVCKEGQFDVVELMTSRLSNQFECSTYDWNDSF